VLELIQNTRATQQCFCDAITFKAGQNSKQEKCKAEWFTPVILATQEAEIRRVAVQDQPGKNKFIRPPHLTQ
jgi:hypothetical protein